MDLLDSIEVQDMNVDASHGSFSGGVVEAKIKKPEKDLAVKISHKYTNGNYDKGFPHSLTKYHIQEDKQKDFSRAYTSDFSTNQPEYYKQVTQISGEAKPTQELGVVWQLDRTYSKIPLYLSNEYVDDETYANYATPLEKSGGYHKYKVNKKNYNYNGMAKVYYDPTEDVNLEFSYTYAPSSERVYIPGTSPNTWTDINHGGHIITANQYINTDIGKISNELNYSIKSDENEANGYDALRYWISSENKNWSTWGGIAREGGYVPGIQTETALKDTFKIDLTPFKTGENIEHKIKAGFEFEYLDATYERDKGFWRASTGSKANNPSYMTKEQQERCLQTDMQFCDPSVAYISNRTDAQNTINNYTDGVNAVVEEYTNPYTGGTYRLPKYLYGQFFTYGYYYEPAKFKITDKNLAFFLQDDIRFSLGDNKKYGELGVRPGIRIDRSQFAEQTTKAPRLSIDYQAPWNFDDNSKYKTSLTFGANRYYEGQIYGLKLQDGIDSLMTSYRRNDPGKDWFEADHECDGTKDTNCYTKTKDDTRYSDLKVPHTDELSFAINQQVGNWDFTGKYIYREGKDDIRRRWKTGLYSDGIGEDGKDDDKYTSNYYFYTNEGKSRTNVVSLMLENKEPINIYGVDNTVKLSLDWTDTKRNFVDYGSVSNYELNDYYIMYTFPVLIPLS